MRLKMISKGMAYLPENFARSKNENGYTIEDITSAYNLLIDIAFTDKKEN